MIVAIHTNFLSDISTTGSYLTTNGLFRIAIPLFLLINGFYFYDLTEKKTTYNWFKRILTLYIFWMTFYAYFWLNPPEIRRIGHILFIGYYHLWYLPGLIGAAFVLQTINKYKINILSPILFFFIVGVAIQYIGNYHLIETSSIDTLFNLDYSHRNFLFLAFPFFSIGFLFKKHNIISKIPLGSTIILTVLGLILLLCESYFNLITPTRFGEFDNLASLLIICPAIFLLFIQIDIKRANKSLAMYSTGIYFIHPFLISLYMKLFKVEGTLLTILVFISSIISSYILIYINRTVKVIL